MASPLEQEVPQTERKPLNAGFSKFIVPPSTNNLQNSSNNKLKIKKLGRTQKVVVQNAEGVGSSRADLMKQLAEIKSKQNAAIIIHSPESERVEPLQESNIESSNALNRP